MAQAASRATLNVPIRFTRITFVNRARSAGPFFADDLLRIPDARAIHADVQRAESIGRGLHRLFHFSGIADVGANDTGLLRPAHAASDLSQFLIEIDDRRRGRPRRRSFWPWPLPIPMPRR